MRSARTRVEAQGAAGAAFAQLRTIPQDVKRARIAHVQETIVSLDGVQQRLSPSAQIRDASNRIIQPMALPSGALVAYRTNDQGQIGQVWILTEQEAAQPEAKAQ